LKSKEDHGGESYKWGEFALDSAMRGIAEEPSPYGEHEILRRSSDDPRTAGLGSDPAV
jgi:hypothetical protein